MENSTVFIKFNRLHNIIYLGFIFLLLGCYPGEPEFIIEYDTTYTNYSPDFNFSSTYTYSLPDGVLALDDDREPNDPPQFIDDTFGIPILQKIRQNLNAQGWTEIDEDSNPDLIVLPSAFDTQFLYFYNPGYWCWYYPCWGWSYPGYAPGYASGYTTGTVFIQITDPTSVLDDEVPVVWIGVINGLLQGSDGNIVRRIENNLDQAFIQPPFN